LQISDVQNVKAVAWFRRSG